MGVFPVIQINIAFVDSVKMATTQNMDLTIYIWNTRILVNKTKI